MKCPRCGKTETCVIDSRPIERPASSVRRRRQCKGCNHRFTTYELTAGSRFAPPELTPEEVSDLVTIATRAIRRARAGAT